MKTYAQLVDKTVINTIIADEDFINESNNVYVEYTNENIAYIGGDYVDGYFYPAQNFQSWSRNGKGQWEPPIPYPNDKNIYIWDEDLQQWIIFKKT